jgi:uncharacterized damage-inducible protein DinB
MRRGEKSTFLYSVWSPGRERLRRSAIAYGRKNVRGAMWNEHGAAVPYTRIRPMHEHFIRLFLYDAWANEQEIRLLRDTPYAPEKARALLAHIVGAGHLWVQRVTGQELTAPVWPEWDVETTAAEAARLRELWSATVPKLDLASTITYTNTKGDRYRSIISDVLTHVAMHGAYHRGQIASAIRASGETPAVTDYIHCTRMGFLD